MDFYIKSSVFRIKPKIYKKRKGLRRAVIIKWLWFWIYIEPKYNNCDKEI